MAGFWKIILVFVCLLHCFSLNAQKIFFEQLTSAEGLPSDYVNCVFEDSKGFLWIGTDKGACRYDGRRFLYFSNDNGLPSNFVSCFAEDAASNIWIGTIDAGVCKYNGKEIIQFELPGNNNSNILKILFNKDNSFFILAAQTGVLKKDNEMPIVLYFFKNEQSPPQVFPEMAFLKMLKPGLFATGSVRHFTMIEIKNQQPVFHPLALPHAGLGNFLYWIGGDRFIALKEKSFHEYIIESNKWTLRKKFLADRAAPFPEWTDVKDVLISGNELYVATVNGLAYVDDNNDQFFFRSENGLGTNFIKSVYEDSRRNVYICTYGAGIKTWPARYMEEFKTNGKVTAIFPFGKTTYIATHKALYKLQSFPKVFYEFKPFGAGNFTSFYRDNKNRIYLGTLNNFYQLPDEKDLSRIQTGSHTKYSFNANTGTSGFLESSGNMYISTYGDGIFLFDGNTTFDTLTPATVPPAAHIVEFLVPLYNSFAALTYNTGITIYTNGNGFISLSRSDGLLSNTVYSAFSDKENETWIGTQSGLNLFDGKRIIKTFTSTAGIIGSKVVGIFRDTQQRLWVLSDKFLHLLENNRLKAIRSCPIIFDEKSPINRVAYNTLTNTLFIGKTDAFLSIDMGKIIPDTVVQSPVLLSVKKDSISLFNNKDEKISLSHPASRISFEFESKYYSVARQPDLYYKLSGFDDDWKLLADTKEAVYLKLPPGEYELIAKSVNPDGYESAETSLIKLEVLPPLWKRNWFIAAAAAVLLGLFFYTGNIISRRRYKQKLRQLQEEYRLQLERERIARELHDNVGSQLTYLINKIDDDYPRLSEKKEAEKLSSFARGAMQELRETIWALDKKEVQWDDLENKTRQLIRLYKNENHTVGLDWQIQNQQQPPLKPLEALNIYRIIQEALNNAEKYSGAGTVKVFVHQDNDKISVEIIDNGKGFNVHQTENGYGLNNMKKRAEEMNAGFLIESEPGSGTTIKLTLS